MVQRLLPAADGSLMAESEKRAAIETLGRLCNESRAVYEVWLQARSIGRLPSYDDLHLKSVLALIPNIVVVDVLQESADYRYRQVGWREIEARKADPTGKTVREWYSGEILSFVLENYDMAAQGGGELQSRRRWPRVLRRLLDRYHRQPALHRNRNAVPAVVQ